MQPLITSLTVLAGGDNSSLVHFNTCAQPVQQGKSGIPRILTYPVDVKKPPQHLDILSSVQADGTMTEWTYLTML